MEKIKEWLKDNPSGYGSGDGSGYGDGSGDGSGYGDGDGYGYGDGDGYGYGYGDGDGSGDGSGYGYGYGYGYGDGSGYGDGYGSGYGDGDGSGYGDGVCMFDGKEVFMIDNTPTIITGVKESFAMGFILNNDFTMNPCFVAKGNGYFAHGKTVKEAREALREKIFENLDTEQTIEEFLKKFKKGERYAGTDFFEWHHYLTGSCLMGRESFVKNKGLDLNAMYTVEEFIDVCKNDYGGQVIKELKEKWDAL